MSDDGQGVLAEAVGDEAAKKLVSIYGEILASLSSRGYRRVPPREVRLAVASALLVKAGQGERDPSRLLQAGLSSLDGRLETRSE